MEHLAIDLGGKASQMCVRSSDGQLLDEGRCRTAALPGYLAAGPRSRVVVETCSEAFGIADVALGMGQEVRVMPGTPVRSWRPIGASARASACAKRRTCSDAPPTRCSTRRRLGSWPNGSPRTAPMISVNGMPPDCCRSRHVARDALCRGHCRTSPVPTTWPRSMVVLAGGQFVELSRRASAPTARTFRRPSRTRCPCRRRRRPGSGHPVRMHSAWHTGCIHWLRRHSLQYWPSRPYYSNR